MNKAFEILEGYYEIDERVLLDRLNRADRKRGRDLDYTAGRLEAFALALDTIAETEEQIKIAEEIAVSVTKMLEQL